MTRLVLALLVASLFVGLACDDACVSLCPAECPHFVHHAPGSPAACAKDENGDWPETCSLIGCADSAGRVCQ